MKITFERQKALGVIPADAELTQRHDEIPGWDELSDDLKTSGGTANGSVCGVLGTYRCAGRKGG